MGSTSEKGGGSKDQRGTEGQKGGRKARRRLAPVRLILIIGAAVLTCGALWNHAMLDLHTAEGLISQQHGLHYRRSLLSTAASRVSSSGGLPITSEEGLSAGAVSENPQHESKQGRGSKYMPHNVVEEDEVSPPAVNAGNVLGRLLDHKLRGQRPAERGGAKQGETLGGVSENESVSEVRPETDAEQRLPVLSVTDSLRQGASVEQKAGADAAVDDRGVVKDEILLGQTGEASANVEGPAARTGLLPRLGVLSKLSSFLALSPRIRQAGGWQANVSGVAAPGLQNQTAQNQTAQTKPTVVLHNLRNARGGVRETSESERRLIEEARRALGEPEPAGGAKTGAISGEDILESAEDRWDLMRIENKLKAEQEYAVYVEKLEEEKARAEAAEAARLKAEAEGAGNSEEADERNGNADGRNGLAEERNEAAEERKEGAQGEDEGAEGVGAGNENGEEAGAKEEAEGGEKEAVETEDESNKADGDEKMELDGEQDAAQSGGQEAEPKSEGGGEALEVVTDPEAKEGDGIKSEEMTTEERVDGNDGESSAGEKAEDEGTLEAGLEAAVELGDPVKTQGGDGASADTPPERKASEEGEGKAAE